MSIRKAINVFKHSHSPFYYDTENKIIIKNHCKLIDFDIEYDKISKYINSLFCVSLNTKNSGLLIQIHKKYPNYFNAEFIIKHDSIIHDDFFEIIMTPYILDKIKNQEDLITDLSKIFGYGRYFRLTYGLLMTHFDPEFVKTYCNKITFSKLSYYFLNNMSSDRVKNYIDHFKLMNYSDDKLKYYVLWSLYHYYEYTSDRCEFYYKLCNYLKIKNLLDNDLEHQMYLLTHGSTNIYQVNFKMSDTDYIYVSERK